LTQDPITGLPGVVLAAQGGHLVVPIAVGLSEATALAAELDHIELERPMAHHLLAALLAQLGAHVRCIEVCDFVDGTFYAAIHIERSDGSALVQDARPSDALALAMHTGAQVRVSPRVVDAMTRLDLAADWDTLLPPLDDPAPPGPADAASKWKM
ncbi:MAG TPA: bifunctional nuclease domain-containing protein, partial [Kofleriaceae bacterium]|nr:bifunctional nuclease domain-containing protein [Kofleriaceae bacterium]